MATGNVKNWKMGKINSYYSNVPMWCTYWEENLSTSSWKSAPHALSMFTWSWILMQILHGSSWLVYLLITILLCCGKKNWCQNVLDSNFHADVSPIAEFYRFGKLTLAEWRICLFLEVKLENFFWFSERFKETKSWTIGSLLILSTGEASQLFSNLYVLTFLKVLVGIL